MSNNQTSPQSYSFRCPLCLKRLGPNEELLLFKSAPADSDSDLPQVELVACLGNFMEQVMRFVGRLENNIQGGVFVSHVNCDVKNPFLGGGRIELPAGDGESCELTFTDESGGTKNIPKTVAHWIVRMLRLTKAHSDTYEPMWYPYLLLAATASADSADTRRPYGNLIELAGSRSVGKTILAVQLIQEGLLALALAGARVSSREYFSPRGDTSGDAFKKELYTFSNWKHMPTMRPSPTRSTPGDLRAVFIERVENREASPAPQVSEPSARQKWASDFLRKLRALISGVQEDGNRAVEEPVRFEVSRTRIPILFYDTAGESQVDMSETTRRVRELTNKLVVCIDGEELCDRRRSKESIRLACKRLDDLIDERDVRRRRTCIVVTKSDLIEDRSSPEEVEQLRAAAAGLNGSKHQSARQLLISMLEKFRTSDNDKLREFLSRRGEATLIHNVFFVGTRNLPLTVGIRICPIKSFGPRQAGADSKVRINASPGYKFKEDKGPVTEDEKGDDRVLRVKEIRLGGKQARFEVINDETVEVTVPSDDARGFIEIFSSYWFKLTSEFKTDEANSEEPFNVEDEEEQQKLKPQSTGLIRFLAWCGDIKEPVITRAIDTSKGAHEQQVDSVAG